MSDRSCLVEIAHRYDRLTSLEKRIADYIIENSECVVKMPIDELARLTGVSPSAVIRCCKSLGFEGYTALKLSLAGDVARSGEPDYTNSIDVGETTESVVNKIFSACEKTLRDTAHFLNLETLEKVALLFDEASMIYALGIGFSGSLSEDLQHRLFQVGYPAIAATDVTAMKDATMCMKKGDVVFAFCNSGRTKVTIDALRLAREAGATTVSLTGYTDSPVNDSLYIVIYTTSEEFKYPIESVTSRVARVAVVDALVIKLSTIHYENSVVKMLRTRDLVEATRHSKGKKRNNE